MESNMPGEGKLYRLTTRFLKVATLLLVGMSLLATMASAFTAGPDMNNARAYAPATLLANGKVLVAGGYDGSYLSSAELYDPTTNSWTPTGTMATQRLLPSVTLLPDGRVLVAGGNDRYAHPVASAELYDPATGSWSSAGPMAAPRSSVPAVLLPNGKVLVVGGGAGEHSWLSSNEIYDPATDSWSPAASRSTAIISHTVTLLPNGKVLAAGGHVAGYISINLAELYDPATDSWSSAGSMASSRDRHTATLLPNGKVLVAGGNVSPSTNPLSSVEIYDPATNSWSSASAMATARLNHTATLLPNGKVLVAGGYGATGPLSSAEIYDPSTDSWHSVGSMSTSRVEYHAATLLANGQVLIAGGYNGGPLSSTDLFTSPVVVPFSADPFTVLIDRFNGASSGDILAYSETGASCGVQEPVATPNYTYIDGPNGLGQALVIYPPEGEPDGSVTYLKYPGTDLLSQTNGTIEFWTYLPSYGAAGRHLLSQGPYPGACAGWTFGMSVNPSGQLEAGAWAAFSLNSGGTVVPLNTWTHVAATWGSAGAKLYINGTLVGSSTSTGRPASGYGGSLLVNLVGYPDGARIDELRISSIQRTSFSDYVDLYPLYLSQSGTGTGIVTSSPAGIDCGRNCSVEFDDGTVVTLSATPDPGNIFAGWSGDCTGTGTCQVTMNEAKSITANFMLDTDGDGVADDSDNCPQDWNADQADLDADNIGDVCDDDGDGDGVYDNVDNCLGLANPDQADFDGDLIGNACDDDDDDDNLPDAWELQYGLNPLDASGDNGGKGDPDLDGLGNYSESLAGTNPKKADTDGDGVSDGLDPNPLVPFARVPTQVTVPATSSNGTILVWWNASATPGAGYVVEEDSGSGFVEIYRGTVRGVQQTGKLNGSYAYRVKAVKDGFDDSAWVDGGSCVVSRTAVTPSAIGVPTTSSNGQIFVWWNASSTAGVTYVFEENAGAGFAEIYRGTERSQTLTGRTAGTYAYRVKAVADGFNDSPWMTGANSCTVAGPVAPAYMYVPATNTTGVVDLGWGASSTAGVSYVVEQSTASDFSAGLTQVYSGTERSATVSGLTSGTYYYRVKATKSGSSSDWSMSPNPCVVSKAVGNPAYLSVPLVPNWQAGLVYLGWGASATPGVTYIVEEAVSADFSGSIQVYSGSAREVTLPWRNPGTYYYRVKAVKDGYDESSWVSGATPCVVSAVVGRPQTNIVVPATSSNGIIALSWGASATPGVTYVVEEATDVTIDPGTGYVTAFNNPLVVYSGAGLTTTLSGRESATYYYRVKAILDTYADSAYRTNSSGCVVTIPVVTPAYMYVPAASSTGTVGLGWGATSTSGATYVVEQSTAEDFSANLTEVYRGTERSATVTGLGSGSYYYRVKAVKSGVSSSWAVSPNPCVVTITIAAPAYMWVPATNRTGTVGLGWGASSTAGITYVVEQSTASDFSADLTEVYTGTARSATVSGLLSGTYYYRVKATKAGGSSLWTESPNPCVVTR